MNKLLKVLEDRKVFLKVPTTPLKTQTSRAYPRNLPKGLPADFRLVELQHACPMNFLLPCGLVPRDLLPPLKPRGNRHHRTARRGEDRDSSTLCPGSLAPHASNGRDAVNMVQIAADRADG